MKRSKKRVCAFMASLMAVILMFGLYDWSRAATYNVKQSYYEAEITQFPESYRAGLTAVKEALPNAHFIYFDTGLDWYADLLGAENELFFGRNLVPASSVSSWKSTEISGSFNWTANEFVQVEPGWNQASQQVIEYYMDPRNFLNAADIFQFEELTYNESVHTEAGVEAILSGTFMAAGTGRLLKDDDGNSLTFAQAFLQIGKDLGVSPYLLASRVRQEQGVAGTSQLISGTYEGADRQYYGYYNYFNINATGGTTEAIVESGLKEAKDNGWDTEYKSLCGGAQKLADNYVKAGKATLYLQHFSVVAQGSGNVVYYYPYMTNVLAPYNEAKKVYQSYSSENCLDETFYFIIPVYKNMPSAPVSLPTVDGNPNNKLKGLSVNDYSVDIGTFNLDKLSYSAIVANETSRVKISAALFASTSSIKINGTACPTGVTDVASYVDLKVGNNTVTIEVTAQNGDVRTYSIVITRQEGKEDLTPIYSSTSVKLSGTNATGIQPGTTVQSILSGFQCTNCTAAVKTETGAAVNGSDKAATGQKIVITDLNGKVVKEYTMIMYGDCNGDGIVNVKDMLYLQRHIVGLQSLSGSYFTAIDLDGSANLNVKDMLYLQRHIVGLQIITQ